MVNEKYSQNIIALLRESGVKGCSGLEIKRRTGMSDMDFTRVSKKLWEEGWLCGVRNEICCARGCRFMCVSYMNESCTWRLIEGS